MVLKTVGRPEVAICTENIVMPALGPGMLFKGDRLRYPLESFVQHFLVCLPLLIQPLLRNIAVYDRNRQKSGHYDAVCVVGIWRMFKDILPIVIYTGDSFLSPG
jgi:hypothetical protein